MTERRVNTLMAGAYKARSARGKYSSAGYVDAPDRQLYIAGVPAGSAQDNLRDLNRPGYRSERPWHDSPAPVFESEAPAVAAPSAPVVRRRKRRLSFVDWLFLCAKRERRDAAACAVLFALILMMTAAWGQKMIAGVEIQQNIAAYQAQTTAFEHENERLEQQLEIARNGERIRNLAQNDLNMLRPERAQTETIYIQTSELTMGEDLQQHEEPRMELLDILLGLLNVLHIGE